MSDVTSLAADLQPLLPLRIVEVEFNHGMLNVRGEHWSLNLIGYWVWQRDAVVVTDFDQPTAEDAVWDLSGTQVVEVRFPDPAFGGDCSFLLSGGSLHVRSDRSDWDTWTFMHDELDVVYVGL